MPPDRSRPPPWSVRDIVTDCFLTHAPGLGWNPGGENERLPLPETLADFATLVQGGEELLEAMAESGRDPREIEKLEEILSGNPSTNEVLAEVHFDTKALLRPGEGGHELRFHTRYPFHGAYAFGPGDRVEGWADAQSAFVWPDLFRVREREPEREGWRYALHTVTLAWTSAAGDGTALDYGAYGWWTVAPVGVFPQRILAVKGGFDFGIASGLENAPVDGAVWRGRATGHVFSDLRRWVLSGDAVLEAERDAGGVTLSGRIENVRVVPLDPETLTPVTAEAGVWHTLELGPVRLDGAARQRGGITLTGPTVEAAGFAGPSPENSRSDWTGMFYGPEATEVAGQWRLWTPPGGTSADGHVSEEQWRRQVLVVGGFGARREKR